MRATSAEGAQVREEGEQAWPLSQGTKAPAAQGPLCSSQGPAQGPAATLGAEGEEPGPEEGPQPPCRHRAEFWWPGAAGSLFAPRGPGTSAPPGSAPAGCLGGAEDSSAATQAPCQQTG